MSPVTSLGHCSTFDVIAVNQNWHHLYLTSAGEKYLSNDAQIRVEPEICRKTLRKI